MQDQLANSIPQLGGDNTSGSILPMRYGTGLYAGKNRTVPVAGNEFSDLEIRNAAKRVPFAPGTPENILLTNTAVAYGEDWDNPMIGAVLRLQLVSKSPGLHVSTTTQLDAPSNAGDLLTIGNGTSGFSFTPVLWTDATSGNYSATFRLVDGRTGGTPLLNHVLSSDHGLRVVVIVNDMSEVNIDARLVRDGGLSRADARLVEITNGCICCTLREEMIILVARLADEGRFDYLLIESTGIGEPMPVARYSFAWPM